MYAYINKVYFVLCKKTHNEEFHFIENERTIYDYLHNSCLNRFHVLCDNKNVLYKHTLSHRRAYQLLLQTIKKTTNNEDKIIWDFAKQGFKEIRSRAF